MVCFRVNLDQAVTLDSLREQYGVTRSDVLRGLLVNAGLLSAGVDNDTKQRLRGQQEACHVPTIDP